MLFYICLISFGVSIDLIFHGYIFIVVYLFMFMVFLFLVILL